VRNLGDKILLVRVLDLAFVAANSDMKIQFKKLLLVVSAFVFTIGAAAADRWETLRAINWVENPTNQTHLGRYGELGPYQFRPATWRMHTAKPFSLAVQRAAADEVAVKHYEWIRHAFEQAGVDPTAFNIALAWNCGVDAVLGGRAPSASYNYAERVSNLVEVFKQNARPAMVQEKEAPAAHNLEFNLDDNNAALRFRIMTDAPRFVLVAG